MNLLAALGLVVAVAPLLDARLQAYWDASTDDIPRARADALRRMYDTDQLVSSQQGGCANLAASDRRVLFRATRVINFYQADVPLADRLTCLLAQMKRDGEATMLDARHVHSALLAQRRFPEANALREKWHLDVPRLPKITGKPVTQRRQVLRVLSTEHAQRRTLADRGWRMVAFVHPGCGFSRRAMAAIAADPTLTELRGRIDLVVPDSQTWPVQDMLAWNEQHPKLPLQPMLRSTAWDGADASQTPVFYLIHNGVVVDQAVGWTGDATALRAFQQRMR